MTLSAPCEKSKSLGSGGSTMGVRPCVTAKLPVLRPWFWNLILLNLAAASCYFIASLGGRVRCKHPFIGRCKMWNCQCPTPAGLHMFKQWSNLLSGPVKQGNKVSLWRHSENRGEDAGVPGTPFKQCWFVRAEAEHTRISLATRVLNIATERKAPQPKARTESEEEAGRERCGQGPWSRDYS